MPLPATHAKPAGAYEATCRCITAVWLGLLPSTALGHATGTCRAGHIGMQFPPPPPQGRHRRVLLMVWHTPDAVTALGLRDASQYRWSWRLWSCPCRCSRLMDAVEGRMSRCSPPQPHAAPRSCADCVLRSTGACGRCSFRRGCTASRSTSGRSWDTTRLPFYCRIGTFRSGR